jgi:hypothetical protein
MALIIASLHDNHLTENCGGDQRTAIDPKELRLVRPQAVCLLNPIAADPFRTLPFALLFGKDQPDKKCF